MNPSPNLPALGASSDALPAGQRRAVVAAILALHGVAGWAVLQLPAVREALADVAPIFVSLIAPEVPPKPPEPAPPRPEPPRPMPKLPPPPAPVITAPPLPVPVPAAFVAPPPPELPPVPEAPAPPVVVDVQAPPAPPPPPPPAPKTIPASAVQYLVAPAVEYPRLSRRANEQGRVMVRVYIDEAGLPRSVQISQSSGHVRLDEAAVAAVQKARFKPYTENGQPTAGWAYTPIDFDLEK